MRVIGRCIIVGMMLIAAAVAPAADYYVDRSNPSPQSPYDTWLKAATNIQNAVNAASDGDTVWVRPGRYTLPTNFVDQAGTNVVYVDKPLDLRATGSAAETIIDGEGKYRGICFYYDDPTRTNIMDGFTVTNGYAENGGGIYYHQPATTEDIYRKMYNCVIVGNEATTSGGGFYANTSSKASSFLVVSNCVFLSNTVFKKGAGMYKASLSDLFVYDSVFENNQATDTGSSGGSGGGGYFAGNGGASWFERCIFRGNVGEDQGGGLTFASLHLATLRNCLLVKNRDGNHDGGSAIFAVKKADLTLENCTIVSNITATGGGRYTVEVDAPTSVCSVRMVNCIIYHNIAYGDFYAVGADNQAYSNNCIADTNGISEYGTGNITNEPKFVDLAGLDLHLQADSPCVDHGVNDLTWMTGAVDLEGTPRLFPRPSGPVDMGAYEYYEAPAVGTAVIIR